MRVDEEVVKMGKMLKSHMTPFSIVTPSRALRHRSLLWCYIDTVVVSFCRIICQNIFI